MQLLLAYGAIAFTALIFGVFLATDRYFLAFLVGGTLAMATLPFHAQIAYWVSIATFTSALIVPFLPGAPNVWEVAGLLGWSGTVVMIMLRRQHVEAGETIRRNKWVFIGLVMYVGVLLITMKARGAGIMMFGSSMGGGRLYLQQLICAVFPLLFAMIATDERTLFRLISLQWIMALTFVVSDFAYTTNRFTDLLFFLKPPYDAMNFEAQALSFGIRRFQSLLYVGMSISFLLLLYNPLRSFLGRRSFWILPALGLALGIGLLSGHRMLYLIVPSVFLGVAICQRFFNPRNQLIALIAGIPLLAATYLFANQLPVSAQRAISFLPGIEIDTRAYGDGQNTILVRKALRKIGIDAIPNYFWIGRGFSRSVAVLDPRFQREHFQTATISYMVNQGIYMNGPVGLMVTTGVFGTLGFAIFIIGGTIVAIRIIRRLRRFGYEDRFALACGLVASYWFPNLVRFIFIHGSAESALMEFGLQAGMLILCERLLRNREERLIEAA
ncbi:MAG: hypothetical protein ACYDC1_23680 [Limisphaerales bacterium]